MTSDADGSFRGSLWSQIADSEFRSNPRTTQIGLLRYTFVNIRGDSTLFPSHRRQPKDARWWYPAIEFEATGRCTMGDIEAIGEAVPSDMPAGLHGWTVVSKEDDWQMTSRSSLQ